MRIAQYQLLSNILIPALVVLATVNPAFAADGLPGVSTVRALANNSTLGAGQESTISRFAEAAGKSLASSNPNEANLEAVRKDLLVPLSDGFTPAFSRAYGARLLESFGNYDDDRRTPQQQMIAFSTLASTGSTNCLMDLAERITNLESDSSPWKALAMCRTLGQGITKAVALDLADRSRIDLARMLSRIASRVSSDAKRHVMQGFVELGGGENADIARRWSDALKALAERDSLSMEDLLCMESATVALRSVLLNPANRDTREAREAAAQTLAPALLAFHAKAAEHLNQDSTLKARLRAHLGRVDQVLPFLGTRGVSLGALWDAGDADGLRAAAAR